VGTLPKQDRGDDDSLFAAGLIAETMIAETKRLNAEMLRSGRTLNHSNDAVPEVSNLQTPNTQIVGFIGNRAG
jgi:hypothetical protein